MYIKIKLWQVIPHKKDIKLSYVTKLVMLVYVVTRTSNLMPTDYFLWGEH